MGAIITLPKFIMHPIFPSTPTEWIMILGIIFFSVSAQLLMNQGFFYCRGWEGGVFMSSEVIFTGMVGIVFMGDPAPPRFWIGGLMVFGSVVALNRLKANGRQVSGSSGNMQK
jgi:drug/metabolite transporter (DMT)-like permease